VPPVALLLREGEGGRLIHQQVRADHPAQPAAAEHVADRQA